MTKLSSALLLCCASMILNSATADDIFKQSTGSWNFADVKGDDKVRWSKVEDLVKGHNGVFVLAVQGVRSPPASESIVLRNLENRLINPSDLDIVVLESEWKIYDNQRRFIYLADLGHGNHLVLVSKEKADRVFLLKPPVDDKNVTPILGIEIQKNFYFTVDVRYSGYIDVTEFKRCVAEYFESQNDKDHEFVIRVNYIPETGLRSFLFGECPVIRKSIEIYFVPADKKSVVKADKPADKPKLAEKVNLKDQAKQDDEQPEQEAEPLDKSKKTEQ